MSDDQKLDLTDEDLAHLKHKKDTWKTEVPKLPEEDMKKCYKILEQLEGIYHHRMIKDPVGEWEGTTEMKVQ